MDDIIFFGFMIVVLFILLLCPPIIHYLTSRAEYYDALTESLKGKEP